MTNDQLFGFYANVSENVKSLKKHSQLIPLLDEVQVELKKAVAAKIVRDLLRDAEIAAELAPKVPAVPPAPPVAEAPSEAPVPPAAP